MQECFDGVSRREDLPVLDIKEGYAEEVMRGLFMVWSGNRKYDLQNIPLDAYIREGYLDEILSVLSLDGAEHVLEWVVNEFMDNCNEELMVCRIAVAFIEQWGVMPENRKDYWKLLLKKSLGK